ncbi:MAG: helix-hairpin-helix domain-containing protein [Desulfobacterota bacterium]|nr:helix-hairpin-helix domain-containing protein [Thermodesulfobacteriota bacterium]
MMVKVRMLITLLVLMAFAAVPVLAQEDEGQPAAPKKPALEGKLNINTATAEQIDMLPGMSKKKAAAVVEYRNAHGKFKTLDDLKNVKGIKDRTIERIKDYVIFDGPTTLKQKDKP